MTELTDRQILDAMREALEQGARRVAKAQSEQRKTGLSDATPFHHRDGSEDAKKREHSLREEIDEFQGADRLPRDKLQDRKI